MTWQEVIYNRLNLQERNPKIIIDKIGLLRSISFREYLDNMKIDYQVVESSAELINALRTNAKVLICKQIIFPSYLNKNWSFIWFDHRKLPIEIDPEALDRISLEELMYLLQYEIEQSKPDLITKHNIKVVLKRAVDHCIQSEINGLEANLLSCSEEITDYNSILKLGKLWGRYSYSCARLNRCPDRVLMSKIDSSTVPPILNGIIKDAFYEHFTAIKTVDKILNYIQSRNKSRIALICFDGMGVAEWEVLSEMLELRGYSCQVNYMFALIPTITGISRSSIFSGNYEKVYAGKSINEDKVYRESFSDKHVLAFREGELKSVNNLLGNDCVKIIYNVFDDIAHKTVLPPETSGKSLYFKSVKSYIDSSTILSEIELLKENGYSIWFCSDHGCVLAQGSGQIIDRYLIETSSRRGTIVQQSELNQFFDVDIYPIPFTSEKVVLLAKDRMCFSRLKRKEITHGGITLDELVVPFVEVVN